MYVFFCDVAKAGIKPIKLYIQRMETDCVFHAVIVVQDSMTPSAKQVRACNCMRIRCQHCTLASLVFLWCYYYICHDGLHFVCYCIFTIYLKRLITLSECSCLSVLTRTSRHAALQLDCLYRPSAP